MQSHGLLISTVPMTDTKLGVPSDTQPQALTVTAQPLTPAPSGVDSTIGTRNQYRFHWSHAIFAIGFIATSSAGTIILVKVLNLLKIFFFVKLKHDQFS